MVVVVVELAIQIFFSWALLLLILIFSDVTTINDSRCSSRLSCPKTLGTTTLLVVEHFFFGRMPNKELLLLLLPSFVLVLPHLVTVSSSEHDGDVNVVVVEVVVVVLDEAVTERLQRNIKSDNINNTRNNVVVVDEERCRGGHNMTMAGSDDDR